MATGWRCALPLPVGRLRTPSHVTRALYDSEALYYTSALKISMSAPWPKNFKTAFVSTAA